MPFTPSHVVAVLPFTRGRTARFFDTAALAVGTMVPDLPYFVPPHVGARWTHAWFGLVTLDLLLGLVVLAVWRAALPGLVALAPRRLQSRVGSGTVRAGDVRDAASVVLGATTHVVWDTFSHPDRWGTRHVAWLAEPQGPLAGYKWVQYGSGVLGLVVLALWLGAWVRRTPPLPLPATDALVRRRRLAWSVAAAVLVAVAVLTWVSGTVTSGRWLDETTAVAIASHVIEAALLALLGTAVLGIVARALVR